MNLTFQESLHELGRICGTKKLLPKSCALSGSRRGIGSIASGCVCEGTLDDSKVRVERVRTQITGDPQKIKEVSAQR